MSTLIYGKIIGNSKNSLNITHLKKSIINYSFQNDFGVIFRDSEGSKRHENNEIVFQLTDNFSISNCEYFFEPILYTTEGQPLIENLCTDINKLYGLLEALFSHESVKVIILTFSYVEVDENEYELQKIRLQNLKSILLEKYLESPHVPVVKFIVER